VRTSLFPGQSSIPLKWVVTVAMLVVAAGCSSFQRDWKAAAATPAPTTSIEGVWAGTWLSHSNGHTGTLQAIIARTPVGTYETRFHATFWKLFSTEYTIHLNATPAGGRFKLEGREDLGRWLFWDFGEFTYEGQATATNFNCTYSSAHDHGVFDMTRPK
jgi:hypothetical protein